MKKNKNYFNRLFITGTLFILACLVLPSMALAVPAFPGAEGYGAQSVGGRGGVVIEVTNLNDSGAGSLRAAIDASGPRTVVFRTGGTIVLNSPLKIVNPYITIAGQTAPGGGICLKNGSNNKAALQIESHDVIIRYLRIRPGTGNGADGSNLDGLEILANASNVIIDHCSVSWGVDENMSSWYDPSNVTIQWSIIAEALYMSTHGDNAPHSMGLLVGRSSSNFSVHHNLLAHNAERNPRVQGPGPVDIANNVIYNPEFTSSWAPSHSSTEYGRPKINYVGNFYKGGANSSNASYYVSGSGEYYVQGNITPARPNDSGSQTSGVVRSSDAGNAVSTPFSTPAIATTSANEAYNAVLNDAGASMAIDSLGQRYPKRDAVDTRVVNSVLNGTGQLINDPSEVGGWPNLSQGNAPADFDRDGMPDDWENQNGLDPNNAADRNHDADGDGYTNLEEYLNSVFDGPTTTEPPTEPPTDPPSGDPYEYTAPVLESVQVSGSSFVLSWSQPASAYGTPSGGYDIILDGVDTDELYRTTQMSTVISGLTEGVEYCFQAQARWLQANPSQTPNSNQICSTIPSTPTDPGPPAEYTAPVLESVQVSGSSFVLSWSQPASAYGTPSGGYDIILDGVDTDELYRTTQMSTVINGLTEGVEYCFQAQARWLQANPSQTPNSNQICATIPSAPTTVPGSLEFAAGSYSVNEGGSVNLTINRVGGSDGAVSVEYGTQQDSAAVNVDYQGVSWTVVNFADGETSKVVSVSTIDDTLVEGSESFNVLLNNPAGGAALGTATSSAVTIIDNDQAAAPVPGSLEFAAGSYSVNEGGSINLTINRVGGSDGAVSVEYGTQQDSAEVNVDYQGVSWTVVNFADGETSKVVSVSTIDDTLVEGSESFNVLLSNPAGGAVLGTATSSAVTIIDNDQAAAPVPGSLEFAAGSYSVNEGGSVNLTINRVGGSDGAVSVEYGTQQDSATVNVDYQGVSWTAVNFADGETSKVVSVSTIDDTLVEGNESFNVLLSNPAGGAGLGTVTNSVVSIADNDNPPVDTQAPVTAIMSHQEGGVVITGSSQTIEVEAVDDNTVEAVEFFVNGKLIGRDTVAPFNCGWKVPKRRNRTHVIEVRAYDPANNLGQSTVSVIAKRN